MIELNGKKLCECCFSEVNEQTCPYCGYNKKTTLNDPAVLPCGTVLVGKYIVGKVIGKGGFGVTYLAYDCQLGKKVAVKEYYPNGLATRSVGTTTLVVSSEEDAKSFQAGAEKFYSEAKLVARFNGNPNIVSVYEFFYENDTVYFAMEYLNGTSLKSYLDKNGTISESQAVFIAENVCTALLAAHSANVMHRDISPDNIMLCDDGTIKLIDFGAARQVTAESSQNLSVILKPGFAPLEQYQKKGKQGPWTDIYALGATLFYALTLDTIDDPMTRMDDDSEFESNAYNISEKLWSVLRKATMLKIEDRYQDIFTFRDAISSTGIEPASLISQQQEEEKIPEFKTAQPFNQTMAQTVAVQSGQPTGKNNKTALIIAGVSAAAVALIVGVVLLIKLIFFSVPTFEGKDDPEELIEAANKYMLTDEYRYKHDDWVFDYEAFEFVGKIENCYQFLVKGKDLYEPLNQETYHTEDDSLRIVLKQTEDGIKSIDAEKWIFQTTIQDSSYVSGKVNVIPYEYAFDYTKGCFYMKARIHNGRNTNCTITKLEVDVKDVNGEVVADGTFDLNDRLSPNYYIDKTFEFSNNGTFKFTENVNKITWNSTVTYDYE